MDNFWNGFEKRAVSVGLWGRAAANRVRAAATPEIQQAIDKIKPSGDFLNKTKASTSNIEKEVNPNMRGLLKAIKGKKNVISKEHSLGQHILENRI